MNDGTYRRLAEAILIAHQRRDAGGGCHCGWDELGKSYAEHVAKVLEDAGALRQGPPPEGPMTVEYLPLVAALKSVLSDDTSEYWVVVGALDRAFLNYAWHNALTDG